MTQNAPVRTGPAPTGHNQPPTLAERLHEDYAPLFKRAKSFATKAAKADLKPQSSEGCAALDKLFLEGDEIIKEAGRVHTKEKEPFLRDGKVVDATFNVEIRNALSPLADRIRQAAADRRLAVTRERQRLADIESDRLRAEAQKLADKAAEQEAAGRVKVADQTQARAEAVEDEANRMEAQANAGLRDASRSAVGDVRASVGVKLVCEGINRAALDLETLRAFIKEDALIAAVEQYLKMGNRSLAGAHIVEKAVGTVRRA